MTETKRRDLSTLYPTAKTLDEQRRDRLLRDIQRRPRYVPSKISTWMTFALVATFISYRTISYVLESGLTSSNLKQSAVWVAVLVGLISIVLLSSAYIAINHIAAKILCSNRLLNVSLFCITLVVGSALMTFLKSQPETAALSMAVAGALLFSYTVTFIIVRLLIKYQN